MSLTQKLSALSRCKSSINFFALVLMNDFDTFLPLERWSIINYCSSNSTNWNMLLLQLDPDATCLQFLPRSSVMCFQMLLQVSECLHPDLPVLRHFLNTLPKRCFLMSIATAIFELLSSKKLLHRLFGLPCTLNGRKFYDCLFCYLKRHLWLMCLVWLSRSESHRTHPSRQCLQEDLWTQLRLARVWCFLAICHLLLPSSSWWRLFT